MKNTIYKYNYKPHLTSRWDLTTPRKGICKDRQERYARETRPGYLNEEIISASESPNALFLNSTI